MQRDRSNSELILVVRYLTVVGLAIAEVDLVLAILTEVLGAY
jgi:hypothetical protein